VGLAGLWVAFGTWAMVFAAMCRHVYRTVLAPGVPG
jgi:hypothetical protein